MTKKILAILLCISLVSIFLPQTVQAEDSYTYIDGNGETKTTEGLTVTPIDSDTSVLTEGWYVVNSDVTREGTISVSGQVNLILVDGFTLTVNGSASNAGISVSPGNSLTIYGQAGGTGTVTATGGPYGAGIGGGRGIAAGTIRLRGEPSTPQAVRAGMGSQTINFLPARGSAAEMAAPAAPSRY